MRRETGLGIAVGLGGLTAVLDTTVAVLAVPVLRRELHAPLTTVQWVTTAYVLAVVAVLPLAAGIGARFGVRRAYVAALLVFALGSVLCGLAPGIGALIGARVVQGLGGGLVNPLGTTLLLRGVPAERRGRVASWLALPLLVGPLLGPVVAGTLLDSAGWRSIFFVTVAPALVVVVLVLRFAAGDRRSAPTPVDLRGALLLVPGVVAVVWSVGEATANGVVRVAAAVVGIVLVTAFVRRSLRLRDPLLRVRLLARRSFALPAAVLTLFAAAYFGSMLLSPTYVQTVRGDSALVAGGLAMAGGLATGLSAQVSTRLVDRVPPGRVVVDGLVLAAVAMLTGPVVLRTDTSYAVLVALAVLLGVGCGAVMLPTITTATRELEGDDLASGATLTTLLSQVATAVGTAAVTAGYSAAVAAQPAGAAGAVDGQRITQAVTAVVVLAALGVALRLPLRRTTAPCLTKEPA